MAKLDLNYQYDVVELKQCLNIENYQVAELGRYLYLPEYRRKGIMKDLQKILTASTAENTRTTCVLRVTILSLLYSFADETPA